MTLECAPEELGRVKGGLPSEQKDGGAAAKGVPNGLAADGGACARILHTTGEESSELGRCTLGVRRPSILFAYKTPFYQPLVPVLTASTVRHGANSKTPGNHNCHAMHLSFLLNGTDAMCCRCAALHAQQTLAGPPRPPPPTASWSCLWPPTFLSPSPSAPRSSCRRWCSSLRWAAGEGGRWGHTGACGNAGMGHTTTYVGAYRVLWPWGGSTDSSMDGVARDAGGRGSRSCPGPIHLAGGRRGVWPPHWVTKRQDRA